MRLPRVIGVILIVGSLLLVVGLVFDVPPATCVYRSDTLAILTGLAVVLSFVIGYGLARRSK